MTYILGTAITQLKSLKTVIQHTDITIHREEIHTQVLRFNSLSDRAAL